MLENQHSQRLDFDREKAERVLPEAL